MLEQDPGEGLDRAQSAGGAAAAGGSLRAVDDPEWTLAQLSRLDLLMRTLVEPNALARLLLLDLAPLLGAVRGAIYTLSLLASDDGRLVLAASYAAGAGLPERLTLGEGLVGQCALQQTTLVVRDVPADHFRVQSALGTSLPRELVFVPVWLTHSCRAVLELAFFAELAPSRAKLLDRLAERRPWRAPDGALEAPAGPRGAPAPASVSGSPASAAPQALDANAGVVAARWGALGGDALDASTFDAREPPPARADKSLAIAAGALLGSTGAPGSDLAPRGPSNQRSGFWGKLSHELRSPLNSVLVLSQLLVENTEDNLTAKQVAFARAIHASGNDLLGLVNAISDLSKIASNRLVLEATEMSFENFRAHLERAFVPLARSRDLEFVVELDPNLPSAIVTDAKRLRQIIKCLLSNAFKFTESGRVSVSVTLRSSGWSGDRARLNSAQSVVAFSVNDTGVGMSESEMRSILDVFPPDQIESRRGSGASGLGMAISRELATLLGGELRVESSVGSGSTFTLYLPTCGLGGVRAEASSAAASEVPSRPRAEPELLDSQPGASSSGAGEVALGEPQSRRSSSGRARKRREANEAVSTELSGLEIMLVDDDVRSAFALTGLLERQGAAVSHAEDVGEALERLSEGRSTSALLIDAELLRSGSKDSVQHMLQRCGGLPIIALTRKPRAATDSGEEAPPMPPQVHQLAKPVDLRQLVSVLRSVARGAKSLQTRVP